MKNEYDEIMDSNGYVKSHIQDGPCFICGKQSTSVRHEIFHGPYRRKSKRYGAWVSLCTACHYRLHNVDPELDKSLKTYACPVIMDYYGWDETKFRKIFGKVY